MTGQEVALRQAVDGAVAQLRDPEYQQQISTALEAGDISPARFLRIMATAVLENQTLAKPELRPSLLRAGLKSAADRLLPDGRESAFVIFGNAVVYMPMIGGIRKGLAAHGIDLMTQVVHENDEFDPDFENHTPGFKRARLGTDRGAILGVYAHARHKDGRQWLGVMDVAEIEKVRATSRAKDSGPWVQWWDRMAEKTVARRLAKSLPLDPKDAERMQRILAATDVNGEQATELLYGQGDASSLARPEQATEGATTHTASGDAPSGATDNIIEGEGEEIPFEGEEPDFSNEPTEADADGIPFGDEPVPTFTAGKFKGKTVEEIYALGDEGVGYLKWALRSWKTGTVVPVLHAFAEEHPEIKP